MKYLMIPALIFAVFSFVLTLTCIGRLRELGRNINSLKRTQNSLIESVNKHADILSTLESDFDMYKDKQAQRDIRFNNDIVGRIRQLETITADTVINNKDTEEEGL